MATLRSMFDTQEVVKRFRAVREWQGDRVKRFPFVKHMYKSHVYRYKRPPPVAPVVFSLPLCNTIVKCKHGGT